MKKLFILIMAVPFLVSAGNPADLVNGNNRFAFSLYAKMRNDSNFFCSPFSISTAMAMTYTGAGSKTADQMSNVMFFSQENDFAYNYKKLLKSVTGDKEGSLTLEIANSLWAQEDYPFLSTYKDLVTGSFDAGIKNVNFKDEKSRLQVVSDINKWVEAKTKNRIKNIIGPGDVNVFTKLILVNAIYFYSDWDKKFNAKLTLNRKFFYTDGTDEEMPFMMNSFNINYMEDELLSAVEIPYKDNKASMVIILPKKTNPEDVENVLTDNYYQTILESFKEEKVVAYLPKFTMETSYSIGDSLSQMGMPLAFSGEADFSGMDGKKYLMISKVLHKAFIKVDETGTEAAAATAVVMRVGAAPSPERPKMFVADHPFIFLIKDNATGSILFMGKVMQPLFNENL